MLRPRRSADSKSVEQSFVEIRVLAETSPTCESMFIHSTARPYKIRTHAHAHTHTHTTVSHVVHTGLCPARAMS